MLRKSLGNRGFFFMPFYHFFPLLPVFPYCLVIANPLKYTSLYLYGVKMEFEMVYKNNYKLVYKAAFNIVRNDSDANDVVSEVFIKLYVYITKAKIIKDLRHWLIVVSKTTAIDYLRKYYKIKTCDLYEQYFIAYNDNLENRLECGEVLNKIYLHNKKWFEILECYYILGMTCEEIAFCKGTTEKSIRMQLYHIKQYARKNLRNEWEDRFIIYAFITAYIIFDIIK